MRLRSWTVVNPVWWWHRCSLACNRIRCSARSAEWRAALLPDSATYSALLFVSRQTLVEGQQEVLKEKKQNVWAKNVTKNEEGDGNPHRATMAAVFADVSTIQRAPWCSLDQTDRCQHAESRCCCRQQHLTNIETQLGREQRTIQGGIWTAVVYFQEAYSRLCFLRRQIQNSYLL